MPGKTKNSFKNKALAASLLAFSLLPALAAAQGWQLQSLDSQLHEGYDFTDDYGQRVVSVGTVVSDAGNLFGTYVLPDGSVHSYNIKFGTNPEMIIFDNPDFVHLAAGESSCVWFICVTEMPFGMRLTDTDATTNWLNSLPDTSPLPGSLPLSRFPGHFVEENSNDIVASTQISAEGQFTTILNEQLEPFITLPDIPWVVALTSGAEPLVLGYRGEDGVCLVYGEDCQPPPSCDDEDDDRHHNRRGRGHREHGRGHGYGHHHGDCDDDDDGDDHEDEGGGDRAESVVVTESQGPVLIQALSDNTTRIWSFPGKMAGLYRPRQLEDRFPLTMNDHMVILRASVELYHGDYRNRLFVCRLGETIDVDGDGVVDCEGGLVPLIPLEESPSVDTVIGFSLNNGGLLMGNFGYNAAGIGRPFMVDTESDSPRLMPLHGLTHGSGGWELNTVSDINASGMAVGYGYQDCSAQPQAWTLYPQEQDPPALWLGHAVQPGNAAVEPGDRFRPEVPVSGGSGDYQYRIQHKTPADPDWQLLHDWQDEAGSWHAPNDYLGDACLRISVRERADTSVTAEKVIRVLVTDLDDSNGPRDPDLIGDRDSADSLEDLVQLGSGGGVTLLLLVISGLIRRRH